MVPSSFLAEAKNLHLEHVEDLILNDGVEGGRTSLTVLIKVRNALAGHSKQKLDVGVKFDGSPAMFCGVDPSDKQFFVAKKGIFNKTPKLYKSEQEIKKADDLGGSLKKKFLVSFQELSKVGITSGVYQGDLMFTKGDIKIINYEGQKYYTFHPNTIVYAVPAITPLGRKIIKARLGIVFHTAYSGSSLSNMSAQFNVPIVDKFKHTPTTWMVDAFYKDVSGVGSMTEEETKQVTEHLSLAGKAFNRVNSDTLKRIHQNNHLLIRIKAFDNQMIRNGEEARNPREHAKQLVQYVYNFFDKFEKEAKRAETVEDRRNMKNQIMAPLADLQTLEAIYEFRNHVIHAKRLIIKKLSEIQQLDTLLLTADGYKVTKHEGFVATDHIGNAVKLVDRLEFSQANFDPSFIKGWQR